MKQLLLFISVAFVPFLVLGQQKPQYSQYTINNYLLNPAIAGIEKYADVKLGSRSQMSGIEGAPTTYYVSAHAPLGNTSRGGMKRSGKSMPSFGAGNNSGRISEQFRPHHGIGILAVHDRYGAFARTEASLAYAYHIGLSRNVRLSGGVSAGLIQQKLRSYELTFANKADAANSDWNMVKPNLSVGLWLYSDNFYIGSSAAQLLANSINFDNSVEERSLLYEHYFLTGAYRFNVVDRVDLIPSMMVMWQQPLPGSVDFSLRAVYDNRVWIGGTYRQTSKFAVLAGVTISEVFDLGYAYDQGVPAINGMGSGNHEVVLGMRIFNKAGVLCPQNLW
ncbi:PorP/SprF family type IX secretion system membrane protein [Pontibacter akesuensis]|uniref:Type IX secretion system membrane protein, PorP/SprF family n=1 Tax=Pontibacter akesuensis TaxID=388950 RepID=A0A1I7H733_9BACT|nr:type IX secretion system membrane protein PorP/SprF [Pontibacter akesuensis]GHA52982.1 membrane protein [Pontibacter akesuensis]SFU56498.1 type IX secretion system membrane protein, PorP/SprF family [Pontibacter akesuensis]